MASLRIHEPDQHVAKQIRILPVVEAEAKFIEIAVLPLPRPWSQRWPPMDVSSTSTVRLNGSSSRIASADSP
jgi:hypothetical protein